MSFFQSHFKGGAVPTIRSTRTFIRNPELSPASSKRQQEYYQTIGSAGAPNERRVSSHKEIREYAEQTLGSGSALAQAVKLPTGEDTNEWFAVNVVNFYNQINMLYGTITEFCSPKSCPRMIATQEYEYLWQDPMNRRKPPVSMSAPGYVEALMTWIQGFLDDESVFPTKMGVPFPRQFPALVKTIMKRLFRVYAHMYCHHFDEINELGIQTHLNTSLKHFVLFCREFNLLQPKDYGPMGDLVARMLQDDTKKIGIID